MNPGRILFALRLHLLGQTNSSHKACAHFIPFFVSTLVSHSRQLHIAIKTQNVKLCRVSNCQERIVFSETNLCAPIPLRASARNSSRPCHSFRKG